MRVISLALRVFAVVTKARFFVVIFLTISSIVLGVRTWCTIAAGKVSDDTYRWYFVGQSCCGCNKNYPAAPSSKCGNEIIQRSCGDLTKTVASIALDCRECQSLDRDTLKVKTILFIFLWSVGWNAESFRLWIGRNKLPHLWQNAIHASFIHFVILGWSSISYACHCLIGMLLITFDAWHWPWPLLKVDEG